MHRLHRAILGLLILPLALASCAESPSVDPGASGSSDGGSGATGVAVPGSPGSGSSTGSGDGENPVDRIPGPVASPVIPTPGMDDVRARGWDTVDVSDDGMQLTIMFVSGIEPCAVLAHVDVAYGTRTVTVTLYEGHDPGAGDVACPEIGVFKEVTLDLTEPLGERTVKDGVA
jgi:hypothetical protein